MAHPIYTARANQRLQVQWTPLPKDAPIGMERRYSKYSYR